MIKISKSVLKKIIALFPLSLVENILMCKFGYNLLSYSQYGEDIILRNIFSKKQGGFFVDVGAHHPTRFSNTYWFYRKGWTGINIDAMPGSMNAFRKKRMGDINIEAAISDSSKILPFYMFNKSGLNTFSAELAHEHELNGHNIKEQKTIKTKTLRETLDKNIQLGRKIDFMTIDVESFDLAVLNSNDWQKYIPEVIVIEDREPMERESKIALFLKNKGYDFLASMDKTRIFKKKI